MNKNVRLLKNGNLQLDTDLSVEDALELPKHLSNLMADYLSDLRTEQGRTGLFFIMRVVQQFFPDDARLNSVIEVHMSKRQNP